MTISKQIEKIAMTLLARLQYAYAPSREYRVANTNDFPHIDLSFYDSTCDFLLGEGFAFLCDAEAVDFNRRHSDWKYFERWMSDGIIVASIFKMQPTGRAKARLLITQSRLGCIQFMTELSDGSFVITDNARTKLAFLDTPQVMRFRKRGESVADLLANHRGHLSWVLEQRQGAKPIMITTTDEKIESSKRLLVKVSSFVWNSEFDINQYVKTFATRYEASAQRAIAAQLRTMLANNVIPADNLPWLEV